VSLDAAAKRVRLARSTTRVSLNGIAKGYAVDRAVDSLQQFGVEAGVVNAGGDLAGFGPAPHVVDIRDPSCPGRVLSRATVRDQALASTAGSFDLAKSPAVSATAVIDPTTRKPADSLQGATVRARSCMIADALTKAVMLAGERALSLLQYYDAAAMLVHRDGAVRVTDKW
jgi:FAD:protein FMN transferase